MKLFYYALSLLLIINITFAQKMSIHLRNGKTIDYSLSDIDNITYSSRSLTEESRLGMEKKSRDLEKCGKMTIHYEEKIYHTVQIGSQCWLKENLNVGEKIDNTLSQSNNETIEKYCYDNNPSYCEKYGGLYQWDEAMQYLTTEKAKGICPTGWHIPTNTELFQTLAIAVNNDGNSLKAVGQGTGSGVGTNSSGFSALIAGYGVDIGGFSHLGYDTHFLSST